MRFRKLVAVILGLLSLALLASAMLSGAQAAPGPDATPAAFTYLPLLIGSPSCPITSTNVYQGGTAYQYDPDNPVRPAYRHADKNIELRGYAAATDPDLRHELIDCGCDDEDAPQLATLFRPHRVPPLTTLYQVNDWSWDDPPDPGERAGPIANPPVTALGLETTPGELLQVPESGYQIGGGMEVIVLFADEDTLALRYAREDSAGSPGYVLHIDGICTDPNLLTLYRELDDPNGPRYVYQPPESRPYTYLLPNLPAGYPIGRAASTETVVAIVDTGVFQDPRSLNEWWQVRPGLRVVGVRPADNDYAKQWSLETIRAPAAWSISTGEEVIIAVIDTGVDLDHPDLEEKVLSELGKNFINEALPPDDDHGHGTHVAGIAAAATDNHLGIAGVGWDASILPLKILDSAGQGSFAHLALAIDYAVEHGAQIINLSLGIEASQSIPCGQFPFLQREIDEAHEAGVVLIAAGGNNEGRIEVPPANCNHVLGVAATTRSDTHPTYSATGSHVSVAAPGGEYDCPTCAIYSTVRGSGYGWLKGTSMATPHVSGLAALLLERYPTYTPDRVASAILDNASDLGVVGYDETYGCGRIDAYAALSYGAHGPEPRCLGNVTPVEQDSDAFSTEPFPASFVPGEVLVDLHPGWTAAAFYDRHRTGGMSSLSIEHLPALDVWRLHVPLGRERAVLARLQADPAVRHAQLNYLVVVQ